MRRAARIDNTAAALIAHLKSLGDDVDYLPLNGVLDGLIAVGREIAVVDWKSSGGELTPAQARLVARGWNISFISTPAQVENLVRYMRGR